MRSAFTLIVQGIIVRGVEDSRDLTIMSNHDLHSSVGPSLISTCIKRDFGIDVPIRCGEGRVSCPYEVEAVDPESTSRAMIMMIHLLARTRGWISATSRSGGSQMPL